MNLGTIKPMHPRKSRKRVGRGYGDGTGKTAGRGQKGQKARSTVPAGYMGGQNPLHMRLPMLRGLSNKSHNIGMFRKEYAILNVGQLERFEAGTEVTPELLLEQRVVRKLRDGIKILGEGEITRPLVVRAHAFSATAAAKIEAAGGTVEVIRR